MACTRFGPILLPYLKRVRCLFVRNNSGMTMVELLVVLALIAVMGGLALPSVNSSAFNLSKATDELIANVRLSRGFATGRGAHYRMTINANSYTVQRLIDPDGDGVWSPDSSFPPQTVNLPATVHIVTGAVLEFDSRGLLSPLPPEPFVIQLNDAKTGRSKQVKVWASGQVYEV